MGSKKVILQNHEECPPYEIVALPPPSIISPGLTAMGMKEHN
jgi:hypothetical protein